MALIVEDGSGLENADAYVSVTEAAALLLERGEVPLDAGASSDAKEAALRTSAQFIDDRFSGRWRGARRNLTQALAFPREGIVTADGQWIEGNSVPKRVKLASAIVASRILAGFVLFDDAAANESSLQAERVKVGPIEIEETFAGGKGSLPSIGAVDSILKPLLGASSRVERA